MWTDVFEPPPPPQKKKKKKKKKKTTPDVFERMKDSRSVDFLCHILFEVAPFFDNLSASSLP